jgi:membrane-associated protein
VTISDQLLAALTVYGLPVLFSVTLISSAGIPLPGTFLLIAAGSFIQLGDLNFGLVVASASVGAVVGDQIGYWVGRWGGRRLVLRFSKRLGGEKRIHDTEASVQKWGGWGIFFSRWLVIQLGPWFNLSCGITAYPYTRFLAWDIAGEIFWVLLFVFGGMLFSDRVQALNEMLGNLAWVVYGLIGMVIFGFLLLRTRRGNHKS